MLHQSKSIRRTAYRVYTNRLTYILRRNATNNKCMSTDQGTYYDSQSGQHVPIHDENKIHGYLIGNNKNSTKSPKDVVQSAKSMGLSGTLLPPIIPQKRDVIDPSAGDTWFLHLPPSLYERLSFDEIVDGNKLIECVNLCFEYDGKQGSAEKLSDIIHRVRDDYGNRVSVGVFNADCYAEDPIMIASDIANIIDATGCCSQVLLSPEGVVDPDDLRSLCEELSYLDVPGPTVKSRLAVQVMNEEQVEECLQMGASKFLVQDNGDHLDLLERAVNSAGKELVRTNTKH